jgi:hypothetical protein
MIFIVDQVFALVRAAFLAATERPLGPFVLAAFLAAAERSVAVRFFAAERACLANAWCETALLGSFFKAFSLALERVLDIGSFFWPFS